MKRLLVLLLCILLVSCKAKREDYYRLSFDGMDIAVGYDGTEVLGDPYDIDSYETFTDDKDNVRLKSLVVYLYDVYSDVWIDDYKLTRGIKDTCKDLKGDFIDKNGHACFIGKEVNGRENYIILYGDILSDDLDRIDRIEIIYDH